MATEPLIGKALREKPLYLVAVGNGEVYAAIDVQTPA